MVSFAPTLNEPLPQKTEKIQQVKEEAKNESKANLFENENLKSVSSTPTDEIKSLSKWCTNYDAAQPVMFTP